MTTIKSLSYTGKLRRARRNCTPAGAAGTAQGFFTSCRSNSERFGCAPVRLEPDAPAARAGEDPQPPVSLQLTEPSAGATCESTIAWRSTLSTPVEEPA